MSVGRSFVAVLMTLPCLPGWGDRHGWLGGPTGTVERADAQAFSFPSPSLDAAQRRAFSVGNALFKTNWIEAPASATGRDGLGPLFNARSCSSCHLRDGRGRPAEVGEGAETGDLVRIGLQGAPHPVLGGQVQDRATLAATPEAAVRVHWSEVPGTYPDGTQYTLQRPELLLEPEPEAPAALGLLVAPHMVGLGLLEAVPASVLEELADPEDRDGDGVSGRVHRVVDLRSGGVVAGRFGWRATQPTVEQQVAAAFVHDIGITSSLFPREPLTPSQEAALTVVPGGSPELDDHKLQRVTFYSQVLAVPAQRSTESPAVRAGGRHFERVGCAACHIASLRTGGSAALSSYRNVTIHPYTDLLLHDMGSGLAGGPPEGDASNSEWRTPPLWGIGLFGVVNGHTRYLHDGRARSLEEAILWHGGEGAPARARFEGLSRAERQELLAFLASL